MVWAEALAVGIWTDFSARPGRAESVGGSKLGEAEPEEPDEAVVLGEEDPEGVDVDPLVPAVADIPAEAEAVGLRFIGGDVAGVADGEIEGRRSMTGMFPVSGNCGHAQPNPVQLAGSDV